MTDTPDISFTQMSKLGTFSGFAIKLLFMSAHLKAAKKEQIFGEGVQRRINYIKAAMGKLNTSLEKATTLNIKPQFEYYLPKDIENEVDVLVRALEGGTRWLLIRRKRRSGSKLKKKQPIQIRTNWMMNLMMRIPKLKPKPNICNQLVFRSRITFWESLQR
jgi:hypothetical protein